MTLRPTLAILSVLCSAVAAATPYFGLQAVDEQTGRGIPLVEFRTVNDLRFVTDNAGWIAFNEPGLMGREVWFYLSLSPGYELKKDGFGYTGVRLTPVAGKTTTVKLHRKNIGERIARTTGQGLFRDSELLELPHSLPNMNNGGVLGQDSVQAVPYRGRIMWLWGDTNVPHYPLGNFRTTAATTPLDIKPELGIAFDYLMDSKEPSRLRHMMPDSEPGAVWLFGLLTVKDDDGQEALLAHYGRYKGLQPPEEHGVCRFSDSRGVFEKVAALPKDETWRYLEGNAVRVSDAGGDFFYFAFPFCHIRVKATLKDVKSPASYEALRFDEVAKDWKWQKELPPTTQKDESKLLLDGKMKESQARYRLLDAASGKLVRIHNGSISWNAYRKRYVLIALQSGDKADPSPLGEVWYAEADAPDGPWGKAVKVATHPRYSYYNPKHHAFLDAEGGRVIYFEGTYSLEFSGNPVAPARYDYNQLMYRLDLSDERLKVAQ
jgi:hypothetical protein